MSSKQLDYYYRKGREMRKAKSKAGKAGKAPRASSYPLTRTALPAIQPLSLYLHRLQATFPLLSKPTSQEGLAKLDLNNNQQLIGKKDSQTFKFTEQSLELQGIRLLAYRHVNAEFILVPTAKAYAEAIASQIAREHGCEIDVGKGDFKLMEIELTEHELTERIEGRGLIPLHYGKDGKPDIWTDLSYGLRGFESKRADYIQLLTDFTNKVVDEKLLEKMEASMQIQMGDRELTHQLIGNQQSFAYNLAEHVKLIKRLNWMLPAFFAFFIFFLFLLLLILKFRYVP